MGHQVSIVEGANSWPFLILLASLFAGLVLVILAYWTNDDPDRLKHTGALTALKSIWGAITLHPVLCLWSCIIAFFVLGAASSPGAFIAWGLILVLYCGIELAVPGTWARAKYGRNHLRFPTYADPLIIACEILGILAGAVVTVVGIVLLVLDASRMVP